jgi:imidazolonepropionase-like amidohydrolase
MKNCSGTLLYGLIVLASLTSCAASRDLAPVAGRVAYVNGMIFDGNSFVAGDLIVEGGRIVQAKPATAETQVDLGGGCVVPPFCEAHNHNLGGADGDPDMVARYLNEGIFYVGILSNLPGLTDPVRSMYNHPHAVDAIFGNGGITATGGHPIRLRESLLDRGSYPGFTRETLADHSYFVVNDANDLVHKWSLIQSFRPDFIKIFLLWSEEFDRRRNDPAFFGQRGLDPALVPTIVERAHAHGLRVFAHVESGHDFHVAVESGVDVIAHLPGNDGPERIAPTDAALAAKRGVAVMTTTILIERPSRKRDQARYAAMRQAQIENLRLLRDHGVKLAVGSDEFLQTSTAEVKNLQSMGIFSNAELLRMWSTDCSQALFPKRNLGQLKPGAEASFVVLQGNPVENFSNTARIAMRIKQGFALP